MTTVLKFEDICKKSKNNEENESGSCSEEKKIKKRKSSDFDIPKGLPVSRRVWKTPKKKFSSVIKTRGFKAANKFEKLKAVKQELIRMRELTRSIVDEKNKQKETKRERRRLNMKKKEANRLKAEIVQVIKNPAKIKRMKKKQLRKIEKRDTVYMKT